jgi:hypothetical protein
VRADAGLGLSQSAIRIRQLAYLSFDVVDLIHIPGVESAQALAQLGDRCLMRIAGLIQQHNVVFMRAEILVGLLQAFVKGFQGGTESSGVFRCALGATSQLIDADIVRK